MDRKSSKLFVGMDVHQESIDIAIAEEAGEVRHQGRIGGDMDALSRAVRKLESSSRCCSIQAYLTATPSRLCRTQFVMVDCGIPSRFAAALPPVDNASLTAPTLNSSVYRRFGTGSFSPISPSVHQKVPTSDVRETGAGSHRRWRPVVNALQACRGIQLIHALRMAELGDLSRVSHPRQLMGYLGLIPSEHSTGEHRHQGAITKAGNSSARRALVEAAWAYRNAAAVSPIIARRQTGLPKPAIDIAWKAQLRLCTRLRRLSARGLNRNKIVVAIARELAGFVWAIARPI